MEQEQKRHSVQFLLREAGISVKVVNMKPYKDPDDFIKVLGAVEYRKRIEEEETAFI